MTGRGRTGDAQREPGHGGGWSNPRSVTGHGIPRRAAARRTSRTQRVLQARRADRIRRRARLDDAGRERPALGPRRKGPCAAVEPAARIRHENFSRLLPALVVKFNLGRMFAGNRATGWPIWKRAIYTAG